MTRADNALPAPCGTCGRTPEICVCSMLTPAVTRHGVLVLQHPQEQDALLGSVPLLTRGLKNVDVQVGLSWRNLADALGQQTAPLRPWAVLYPASLPAAARKPGAVRENGRPHGAHLINARGRVLEPFMALGGVIVLDGTWSQAKALWWRNPWLLKLPRLCFGTAATPIYGRLRREPKPGYVSTLEAAAMALDALGEKPEPGQAMRRAFRTLVQRLRDQKAAQAPVVAARASRRPQQRPRPEA